MGCPERQRGAATASTGAEQTHVKCAAANADVQFGKLLDKVKDVDAAKGGETLVVLTADHGATYGEAFNGKTTSGAGDTNWYYAPNGVWDAGAARFDDRHDDVQQPVTRPAAAAGHDNLAFVYGSTAVEAWLVDRTAGKMQEAAAAGLKLAGSIALVLPLGRRFRARRHQQDEPVREGLVEGPRTRDRR